MFDGLGGFEVALSAASISSCLRAAYQAGDRRLGAPAAGTPGAGESVSAGDGVVLSCPEARGEGLREMDK